MAAKKSAPQASSKAAFVRSFPAGTPAKEIVEKAKAANIVLDVGYIYNVRSTSKKAPGLTTRVAPAVKANGNAGKSAPHRSGAEELLRALGAELGLGRAIRVLESERARLRSILG